MIKLTIPQIAETIRAVARAARFHEHAALLNEAAESLDQIMTCGLRCGPGCDCVGTNREHAFCWYHRHPEE